MPSIGALMGREWEAVGKIKPCEFGDIDNPGRPLPERVIQLGPCNRRSRLFRR